MSVCPKSHWSEKMNKQFPVIWRAPHFWDASILLMEILHQSIYDRYGYCPIIYKVLFIPGAAGFLPSTTSSLPWKFDPKTNIVRPWPTFHISLIMVFVHGCSTISPGSTFLPEQWGRSWGIIAYNPWSKETLQSHDSINCFRHSFLCRFSALLAHQPPRGIGRWWTQRTRFRVWKWDPTPTTDGPSPSVWMSRFTILFHPFTGRESGKKSRSAFGGNKINRCAP